MVNFFGTILAGKDAVLIDFFAPANIREEKLSKVGIDYVLCSLTSIYYQMQKQL